MFSLSINQLVDTWGVSFRNFYGPKTCGKDQSPQVAPGYLRRKCWHKSKSVKGAGCWWAGCW